jgi:uncharacterized iron-regulated membrane protein
MSESEKSSGLSTGMIIVIGVVCILVAGGCLVACAGLAGVGFMLPAVRQAQQAQEVMRAEEAARQAAENAEAKAQAAQKTATETGDRPATDETAQPAADDAPAKDEPRDEDDGSKCS